MVSSSLVDPTVAAGVDGAVGTEADTAVDVAVGTEADARAAADAARSAESWALVRAAQQGDTAAFGRLYDRYVDVVHRYVLFRVHDRPLAEDITSETFVRALRRLHTVSYQGRDVGAWFVTIARNLVLDHVKSSRVRLEVTSGEMLDPGSAEGPEAEVVRAAVARAVLACVDQLGPDQRECVVLRFVQGLSLAETAVVMDRREGAVKALQHRAVRRLAALLPPDLR
ncbi:sigma-70 family RNA polymerase sigma factor [Rhodococcus aerolatus]